MKDLEEDEESEEDDESADEDDDAELTKFVAEPFLSVLPMIANRDPSVYEPKKKFFPGSQFELLNTYSAIGLLETGCLCLLVSSADEIDVEEAAKKKEKVLLGNAVIYVQKLP